MRTVFAAALLTTFALPEASAQRARVSPQVRSYVTVDTTIVALTNARVIDGTGAAAKESQTIIIRDGKIAEMGSSSQVHPPAGALLIDLAGKTVIPGLVMVHEHFYYPTGPGVYANLAESFSQLYLAGGVTSLRTGGNMNGFGDLNIARAIERGEKAGPWIDATAPYLEGPGLGLPQVRTLKDSADARRQVEYWADEGMTSFKVYMNIRRAELKAVTDAAHKRGLKVTGHLCSITYREAAELGIDDLEHGFMAMNDFVPNKQPDQCPRRGGGATQSLATLDPNSAEVKALFKTLIDRKVAVTSTLTIFETFTPGRPLPAGLEMLLPQLREQYVQRHTNTARATQSVYTSAFPKNMAMELAFARAGGTLIVGTDPTGGGGLVPGYSNQRAVELLVESGFTPLEAIRIATLNGATYLGRADKVGTVAIGKQADLVVIDGNPAASIGDIRKVQLVFRQGIGYDPSRIREALKGKVGLY
jgi:enamidase